MDETLSGVCVVSLINERKVNPRYFNYYALTIISNNVSMKLKENIKILWILRNPKAFANEVSVFDKHIE